ncbi:hypothetical protein WKI71_01785 [Streptomyces sp. MS1.AVA.1]|uniref:Uncharacterized protein n=1 Tax=Streptomyces machairae TaxID=3134109 RepID=A0ABU8UFS3_9ACTN
MKRRVVTAGVAAEEPPAAQGRRWSAEVPKWDTALSGKEREAM